jgi:endonuclease/exonuclease/phosphatase family metal-dependent hydrolase
MIRTRRLARLLATLSAVLISLTACASGPVLSGIPGPLPPAPTQVQASVSTESAVATWIAADASHGFELDLDVSPQFTNPRTLTASAKTRNIGSLKKATTYYLRVSALSDDNRRGPASEVVNFTTFAFPGPTLAVDSASSTSLTAKWTQPEPKLSYELQLGPDSGFTKPSSKTTDAGEWTFTQLKTTTKYYLRVRVVSATGEARSDWSKTVAAKPAEAQPLVVANYNVDGAATSTWVKRRPVLVNRIASQHPDVLGLQEAGYKKGHTQYLELTSALGKSWRVTESARTATSTIRIAYDSKRVQMVRHGHVRLTRDTKFGNKRFIVWAEFKQLSTGKHFLFLTTHLVYQKSAKAAAARTAEAKQVAGLAKQLNRTHLPVIVTGDFNTHLKRTSGNGVYRTFLNNGFADPLSRTAALGSAESRIRADLEPYNGSHRTANMSASTTLIDHIFLTPMRVAEWETVGKLNGSNQFVGVIPSDHGMLRATVYLP